MKNNEIQFKICISLRDYLDGVKDLRDNYGMDVYRISQTYIKALSVKAHVLEVRGSKESFLKLKKDYHLECETQKGIRVLYPEEWTS